MIRARIVLAAAAVALAATPSAAQQSPAEEPFRSVVRLDNESVRVVELRYAPGAAAPMHSHEHPRVVYIVEGGLLELVSAAGDTSRVQGRTGQTVWRPAETHSVRNVGSTPVLVVETEVKQAARPR